MSVDAPTKCDPWWLPDHSGEDLGEWIDGLARDKVMDELVHEERVAVMGEDARARVIGEIAREAERVERAAAEGWRAHAMCRGACDDAVLGACPWQEVCWDHEQSGPEKFGGLYQIKESSERRLRTASAEGAANASGNSLAGVLKGA